MGNTPPWKKSDEYVAAFQYIEGFCCGPGYFEYSYRNHFSQKDVNWAPALAIIKEHIPEADGILSTRYNDFKEAVRALDETWAPVVNAKLHPYGYFVDAFTYTEKTKHTSESSSLIAVNDPQHGQGMIKGPSKTKTYYTYQDYLGIRIKIIEIAKRGEVTQSHNYHHHHHHHNTTTVKRGEVTQSHNYHHHHHHRNTTTVKRGEVMQNHNYHHHNHHHNTTVYSRKCEI
jgi:hypothetical protein